MQVIALGLWFHDGKSETELVLVSTAGELKVIFGDVPLDAESAHGFFAFLLFQSGKFRLMAWVPQHEHER